MKSQKETIKLPGLAAWWGISSQRCKHDLHFRLLPSLVLHHQWDRGGRKKQIQTYNSCPFSCHDLFSSCARSAMEPRIQATTPAMTFSKAGLADFVKKEVFLISYQVDKPRHLTAPGWQDVSWGAWKSFSHRRGILPQSASSVPTQIASNHFCGPHQQNVHYLYLASIIVIFFLFFFVRRSDRFQYFATSGEWSTSYQSILAAANMFAT